MPVRTRLLFPVLVSFLIAACGGSSPSGTTATVTPPASGPGTARVTVLLTDAPGTDWDEAHATITSIELLGDEGRQSIFEGSTTVDLLSLPDYYDIFAVADDIQPGTFSKVRLYVDSLELVERDDEGVELQRVMAQLVGGGKIDLNPQGDFYAGPGDSLYIEIDFDMHKAFKTTTTGNDRVIVRPVVIVNISRVPPLGRLTRVRGTIQDLDQEDMSFDLCQQELVSESDDDDSDEEDDDNGDHEGFCIEVTTDDLTGLFGADGTPITFDLLANEEMATAIGHLRREEDDDDDDDEVGIDDDDDIVLHAVTVELGEPFLRVSGIAEGIVNGDVFDLALDPGQGIGTDQEVLASQVYPKTRVFNKNGEELDTSAIESGVGVLADGVLVQEEGLDDLLRTALLILDLDMESVEEVLRGEILSINFDAGSLQLMTESGESCINALDADIFVVSNVDGFLSERVGLGDLEPGQSADAFGEGNDDSGCFVATNILASALPNTLPVADAGEDQSVGLGSVNLDGSGSSDDDGDVLSYSWSFASRPDGSTAELSAADTAMASFSADVTGEYVVELVVNDGLEDSAPDSVTITVAD